MYYCYYYYYHTTKFTNMFERYLSLDLLDEFYLYKFANNKAGIDARENISRLIGSSQYVWNEKISLQHSWI